MNISNTFILNDTAKNDPAVQLAMANYVKQLEREEARRQAILSGKYISCPETVWNISDRD
jgi:uncharacterized protein (UPF0212 family)